MKWIFNPLLIWGAILGFLIFGSIERIWDAWHHEGPGLVTYQDLTKEVSESQYKRHEYGMAVKMLFISVIFWVVVAKVHKHSQLNNRAANTEVQISKPEQAQEDGSQLICAYTGEMNFMTPFLREGGAAAITYANLDGDTLLHAAADGWQYRMVEFLALSGANPDIQNKDGNTPLHTVVERHELPSDGRFLTDTNPLDARKATLQILLHKGADCRIKNNQGANPLHVASSKGDLLAIDSMILGNIDLIDEVTAKGATALALAIVGEHFDCTKRLLELGADAFYIMPRGVRPMDLLYSIETPDFQHLFMTISQRKGI